MRITILVDNLAAGDLRCEHGLSFLIDSGGTVGLFDIGQTDVWLQNLEVLGHRAAQISFIALSHGHYDHAGGLPRAFELCTNARYFAHPTCFLPKYAECGGNIRQIGMPEEAIERMELFTLNTQPVEILPGIVLSGEIPRGANPIVLDKRFLTGNCATDVDTFEDEQCLVVRGTELTAVLVGCAHKGVENNILAAMEAAKIGKVDLLMGGFHLQAADATRLESLAKFLEKAQIQRVVCCHCTGNVAFQYLSSRLGSRVVQGCAGTMVEV